MTTFIAHKRDSKSPGLHYLNGGTGRESYIAANNGGYSVSNGPTVFERGGSLNAGKGPKPSAPSGGRAQVRYYRPDGRGRDTYISHDQGGFMFAKQVGNPKTFETGLRKYEKGEVWHASGTHSPTDQSPERLELSPTRRQAPDYFQLG